MSESGGGASERASFIRAPRDFWGGLALIALALFALWASRDLPGMRGFAFGPGTAPRMFAIVLGVLGLTVSITGLTAKGPGIERFYFRGPFFITLSVGLFAWMVRPLGLVIASFLSILAAAGATPDARLIETLIWGALLTNSWDAAAILKSLFDFR
jgi:putative tricarboxylic transport membrane protein